MNSIVLRIHPKNTANIDDWDAVNIFIDGIDLRDMIKTIESPFAKAEGHPDIAGGYCGLSPQEWMDLPEQEDDGRSAIMGCQCGYVGCWPLRVRITFFEDTVIWSDFEQPHRPEWKYDRLGPFVFSRKQYEAAVAKVISQDKQRNQNKGIES